ncbi:MAG TPA: ABC transporter transmembrane domain-containing protein, partial [Anaerolineales bacterium]
MTIRLDPRLLNEAGKRRPSLILSLGLGLAGGLLSVLQARYLSWAIDGVFLKKQSLQGIQGLVFLLLAVIVLRAATAWGSDVAAHSVAAAVKLDLRARLYAHLATLGPSYTAGERSGELSNTLLEGIESLEAYFGLYLPQLALAALVPLTVLVFVFPIDLISGLVLLLTAPLIPVFMILIGSLAEGLTRKQWLSLSRM